MDERQVRYIVCPLEVFLDTDMDATEKILLMEIDGFCKRGDGTGCYASNEYLAKFCGCSDRKISQAISHLKELGYIEQASFDGRRRVLRSRLADSATLPSRICDSDSQILRTDKYKSISNSNKEKIKDTSAYPIDFNAFWTAFPKKKDKANAEKAFRKVDVPIEVLLTALEKQKKSADWIKEGGKYIPYPSTWLNGRRWEDDVDMGFLHGHVHRDGTDPKSYEDAEDRSEELNKWD